MSRPFPPFLLVACIATGTLSAANAGDAIVDIMAATFKIANESSTATCFVIARPGASDTRQQELFLVTAGHVLEKMSGDECRIVLREKSADGTFVRKEVPLKIRSANKPLWFKHPEVDVAALNLKLPAGQKIASLDFDQLAGDSTVRSRRFCSGDEVWILCYPAQLEANSAGFPILRRGTVASFPLTPIHRHRTYLVDYSTFAGDSGAPVLARDHKASGPASRRALVVGLVVGFHRETTKSSTPIEEHTIHRPLGLAIVVHAEFLRQTIDRATK